MVVATSIDDLFRQKSLNEIHDVLRQTRSQVEAKKQELRELVGDHYRSMLESTDHIRVMSECAAKVSAGADRIEGLIASMRELAANPPTMAGGGARMFTPAKPAEEDQEYRVGQRVMALLEVPETVRAHLAAHAFARAAHAALVNAAALRDEVAGLLSGGGGHPAGEVQGDFDLAALVQQQEATLRGLPRQIAASCVDAFGTVALERASAAEAFAVFLLLRPSAQPAPLLALFLRRRSELLRGLLDGRGGHGGSHQEGIGCGARLASAAMAFEGTVILGSNLCADDSKGGEPALLKETIAAMVESWPDSSAAEERATMRGVAPDALGPRALRQRAEALGNTLRRSSAMEAELARLGQPLLQEFMPEDGGASGKASVAHSLSERFGCLIATAPSGELSSCTALGEVLRLCTDKVFNYRLALSRGFHGDWPQLWRSACQRFRPGRAAPPDALAVLSAIIETACAEVVRERAADIHLELVSAAEESLDEAVDSSGAADSGVGGASSMQSREEVQEMQRQSRLRVARFNEQLGELLSDLDGVKRGGAVPVAIMAALLGAVGASLSKTCERVRLPPTAPAWPRGGGAGEGRPQEGAAGASKPPSLISMQRSAGRAATAFDALLSAVLEERPADDSGQSHLHALLSSAVSSGDPGLVSQAHRIEENVRHYSDVAYGAWARLAAVPEEGCSALESFWRLADDEVPHVCGWGSASFARGGAGGADAAKAVPVPVQASPFVFERLALGARRAMEVSNGLAAMPQALVTAMKVALSEVFAAAYEAEAADPARLRRSGMNHLLQCLFDLQLLRIAFSAPAAAAAAASATGPAAGPAAGGRPARAPAPAAPGTTSCGAAHDALLRVLERAEAAALSDPVDRLLYQEVLKASVKSHVQGVKVLLAPFFLYNPLHGFLFQGQPSAQPGAGTGAGAGVGRTEGDGFELQAALVPPLRPAAQRFLLLPVANASALAPSAEFDARLGLGSESAERAAARAGAAGAAGDSSVSSLLQQGLGSLGLGKAAWPLSGNWASGWSGGAVPAGARPPEAV